MSSPFPSRLPLSRAAIDRDAGARLGEDLFARLWADPATRVLPMWRGSAALAGAARLRLLPAAALAMSGQLVYLGRTLADADDAPAGAPVVAVDLDDHAAGRIGGPWGNLRELGDRLDDRDAGLFTEALAILNWHASHEFSPRSGARSEPTTGGWVRYDPVTRTEIFPRTDPAVIVAVTDDDDRLLLGSNALWEHNRYSLLAGFVEPGESLEAAVQREVFEESGLPVVDPVYRGSQPWPFPASLMVGFTARVASGFTGRARADGEEILELRWFSRECLREALPGILLPGPSSIARALIEEWYGGPIDDGRRA